jgi:hypothetical protein
MSGKLDRVNVIGKQAGNACILATPFSHQNDETVSQRQLNFNV